MQSPSQWPTWMRSPTSDGRSQIIVIEDDLRITVYTAEPGTEDADRLAVAVVLGTQALVD